MLVSKGWQAALADVKNQPKTIKFRQRQLWHKSCIDALIRAAKRLNRLVLVRENMHVVTSEHEWGKCKEVFLRAAAKMDIKELLMDFALSGFLWPPALRQWKGLRVLRIHFMGVYQLQEMTAHFEFLHIKVLSANTDCLHVARYPTSGILFFPIAMLAFYQHWAYGSCWQVYDTAPLLSSYIGGIEVCRSNCQSYLLRLRSSASSQPPGRASMYTPHIIDCCRISSYMWPTSIFLVTQLGETMTVMILPMPTGRSLLAMQSKSFLLSRILSGCLYILFASNTF